MAGRPSPTPGELVILIAGAAMLVFSFLDFGARSNVWESGLFPVATLLPLYGVLMALQIALTRLGGVRLPPRVAGFTWEQVHLALGIFAALMALAWLGTDGDKEAGLMLEALGGIALLAGALAIQRERGTGAIGRHEDHG